MSACVMCGRNRPLKVAVALVGLATLAFVSKALTRTQLMVMYMGSGSEPSSDNVMTQIAVVKRNRYMTDRPSTEDKPLPKIGIPDALVGLIDDVEELKGRHSDYITPPCQNSSVPIENRAQKKYDFLGPFSYLENYKNPCWVADTATGRIQCVPYFYVISATKAGSTDVFWRLVAHDHAHSGKQKEARWFDRTRFGPTGTQAAMPTFQNYLDFFSPATQRIKATRNASDYHPDVMGDGSPTYFYGSFNWQLMPGNENCVAPRVTAMSHIHRLWPKAKLIMVLRNPVDRMLSTYLFNSQAKAFNGTAVQFDEWIRQCIGVWLECRKTNSHRTCMYSPEVLARNSRIISFASGMYSRYILDLLKIFPRDQIFFVHLETYSQNIKETLRQLYQFLELDPPSEEKLSKFSAKAPMNRGKNYKSLSEMWPSTRKLLEDFHAPYNAELSAIMGGDPRWLWKS